MSKQTEKLKKQLIEISEVVNLFKSEAVQVKVIDRLFDVMIDAERFDADTTETLNKRGPKQRINGSSYEHSSARKKPGATKVLNQLLTGTDFFDTHRSISSIADYCKNNYDSDFKTSELSGILLKLANEHKLRRERSNANNRFEYVKA
ncbi:MAG: hypothetical protein JWO58_3249 [Chitinophagaceae bacterium]|nr:hypothetical protein [Chitinophagaceae bacterium]